MTEKEVTRSLQIIRRGVDSLIHEEELRAKLKTGKPLIVKLGADPSAADIHLGHVVVLKKLRDFQDLGHDIRFLIGDFTATIGDPSGRSKTRPALSRQQISENAKTYQKQIYKILNPQQTSIQFNSHWSNPLSLRDALEMAGKVTVARIIERDDFMKRYKAGKPISLSEFFYPILQGFDSVMMKADVELGGSDQTFNLLFARELMKAYAMPSEVIITMPLLEGLDGVNKMSKSLGNYVGVFDEPNNMFGKIMSLPDSLILRYCQLLSNFPMAKIKDMQLALEQGENPRTLKISLAKNIVSMLHHPKAASLAEEQFIRIFSKREMPLDTPSISLEAETTLLDVLMNTKDFSSKSEIRRLIHAKAVKINSQPVADEKQLLKPGQSLQIKVGKRRFYKIL